MCPCECVHAAAGRVPAHACVSISCCARTLLQVMAQVMDAEAALVRIQFMSGTHAIAAALFAALRPGDEMLAVVGQ